MGPNHPYKLLYSKGNHKQNKKATNGLAGRKYLQMMQFPKYKQLIPLNNNNNKKKQITQSKNGQTIQTDISPRRHTDGQEAHEKMLNITNY